MNLMNILFGEVASVGDADSFLTRNIFGGGFGSSHTGLQVSEQNAMMYSAFYGAVSVISKTLAHVPLVVFERIGEKEKRPAIDHPTFKMLSALPNDWMTSVMFRETLQGHILRWGNAYAEIVRNNRGQAMELWPLLPDKTTPKVQDKILFYETQTMHQRIALPMESVLHIPGLSFNGIQGLSILGAARNAIGLGLATEEFASKYFKNGAFSGGFLEHEGKLDEETRKKIIESITKENAGLGRANRIGILWEGMKFNKATIPAKDSQFLETRVFEVVDIARFFNLPPHKIQSMEKATFSNIEQQALEFVTDTMMFWYVKWEHELNRKLFAPSEQGRFFVKFKVQGLLRGDNKSRAAFYKQAIQDGWMNRNEVRELEDLNPQDGLDEFLTPLNMQEVGEGENENEDQP
jgi:HK97 family phage portal protein